MRVLLILLALAAPAFAQCPNGNCPAVRVTVTVPAPRVTYAAQPPVAYAVPVYVAPVPVVPVAYAVPTRTPWYPTKWLRGRRGQ
jgi:hypothetical protein